MGLRAAFGIAVLLGTCAHGGAWAVKPSSDEMRQAGRWIAGSLSQDRPPLSFVYDGRPSADVLLTWGFKRSARKLDKSRKEHVLTWTDPKTGLEIVLRAVEYSDYPAVEWVLHLSNTGKQDTPIIEDVRPLDVQIEGRRDEKFVLHHSLGDSNSAMSFAPVEDELNPGGEKEIVLSPTGGRSSDPHMPFFNLVRRGGGIVLAIGWSGQWEAGFRCSPENVLSVRAGQQITHLKLHPGETIRTPRILLVFWQGEDPLRGNNLFRRILMDHYIPRRNGELVLSPICASVNNVDPDGSYEGPHVRAMKPFAERGIEVFWSDMDPQQWYPKGFPEGTGTWVPDPAKYPRGLAPIGEAAHSARLGYLLWFEPERVHPGSKIDREHPEWVMKPKGEWSRLFRLHDSAARKWLTDYIDVQISAAKLDWIRWDFNIEPLGFWRRNDEPDRQGITEIRHIEGLYAMWDDLRSRHPGLVIDNCASGGRRIDIETLTRGLPLWHSDLQCGGPHPAADQLQNGGLFRWVPMHGCGNFGYEPDYLFRSAMTAGNILVPSNKDGVLSAADPDTADAVKRTVAVYKKVRPYMIGDFYPLFPHDASEEAWYGYQFHRSDLNAGIAMLFRREKCPDPSKVVKLRDIDPKLRYEVTFEGTPGKKFVKGTDLSALEVEIPSAPGSAILCYRAVK